MSTVTWLHISDLHWRESQAYDANVVAQALLRDLANRAETASELEHIDFIFVTGDIAFASQPEEYRLARQFFRDLLRTTGVRKSRLFIVPGNHDVDRTAISDDARDTVNMLSSRQSVNRLLDDEVGRAIVMQRFHRYRQFVNDYLGRHLPFDSARYFYVKRHKMGDKRIAILGLNSAWASASDAERRNLFLGERQVRVALDEAKQADIRIALVHHPFEWLRDFDRDDCEPLLLRGCDFVLHGHLHRTGLMRLQAPGSEAMVIGAGSCYETREYPNAYNLVHLDFSLGKGTVYLRMYSDQQGGFWTEDLLTYQDAPGEYTFNLPHDWITTLPARSADDAVTVIKEEHEVTVGTIETPYTIQRKQHADYKKVGLAKWWDERGYESNPFAWSNAADVGEDSFSELFQLWHIDPKTAAHLKGMGPTPTLDKVKSLDTSRPILIYAPGGGGKTFYRRWAARQIAEENLCALEIWNIGERVRTPENVTAWNLAVCIYDHVCERFSIPKDPSPPEHIRHIFKQCDEVLQRPSSGSQRPTRLYVFIDDIDQLFDEQPSGANRNAQALTAIVELCRVAARRGGGEPLALRMFVPAQLRAPIRNRLGIISHRRIEECLISWSAEHCEDIIERRLDSCWKDGPNTDMSHISRLLTQDARDELRRWLQRQKGMSPGRVIEVLNRLAHYACSQVDAHELIDVELWKEFSRSSACTDLCAPDAPYPLGRPSSKFPRWLWPAVLLMLSLGVILYVSPLARGILEAAFFASVRLVHGTVTWLASASDWIQAFLLLSALLGSIPFVLWCLIESARLGQIKHLKAGMRLVKFGADGIRGIARKWPFTPLTTRRIGCALGQFVLKESTDPTVEPRVMIGRDTRPSGNMIASELKNGLLSQGVDVIDLGIVTTPSVAYLTRHQHADLGVIVSASHNPHNHNGIKLVGPNGLRPRQEKEIEDLINQFVASAIKPELHRGRETNGQDLIEHYIQDQVELCPFKSLKGLKLVLDCANGAASQVAPQVFTQLDAEVAVVNDDLTGCKINSRCGSEHARQRPQDLIETVQLHGAAYGLAFDGDGDRLVIVDENGCVYNGDDILFILATYFHEQGKLRGNAIVTTDMANTGLKEALSGLGIRTVLTKHGDKHLEAEIWSKDYLLGSEQVGNILINDGHHAAADPLYAALILSGIICDQGALYDLVAPLRKRPQVLASVHLASTPPLEQIIPPQEEHSRTILGKDPRVLMWYSSTECGLFKTMVEGGEGNTLEEVRREAVAICKTVQQVAGPQAQEPTVLDLSSRNRAGS